MKHLERADFVRAVIFGLEAFVTQECETRGRNPDQRQDREEVVNELRKAGTLGGQQFDAYDNLNALRNALVHGTQPRKDSHKRPLRDQTQLRTALENDINRLLTVKRES